MLPKAVSVEGQNSPQGRQRAASAPSHLCILLYSSALRKEGKLYLLPSQPEYPQTLLGVGAVSVLNTED